jgi:hypothetical protein
MVTADLYIDTSTPPAEFGLPLPVLAMLVYTFPQLGMPLLRFSKNTFTYYIDIYIPINLDKKFRRYLCDRHCIYHPLRKRTPTRVLKL